MKNPTVSVVITTMNRPQSLSRAIKSVLSQTYQYYDLHIVDDGSIDETSDVIKSFQKKHSNIYYWHHESRRGLAAARNTGIAKSTGEFIAFLDDDDEWKPDSLSKRIEAVIRFPAKHQKFLGVIYSGCEIKILDENRTRFNIPSIEGNIKYAIRQKGLSTIPSTGLHPRLALEKIGGFDENLVSSVDHDLWMSLASYGFHAVAVREPLTITYIRKNHKSMVCDTRPRIQGVEQYLEKWEPTFQSWFGAKGAMRYIRAYRTCVLGRLAVKKMMGFKIREALKLKFHVSTLNQWDLREETKMVFIFLYSLFRKMVPVFLLPNYRAK